jgi:hypothetical protein
MKLTVTALVVALLIGSTVYGYRALAEDPVAAYKQRQSDLAQERAKFEAMERAQQVEGSLVQGLKVKRLGSEVAELKKQVDPEGAAVEQLTKDLIAARAVLGDLAAHYRTAPQNPEFKAGLEAIARKYAALDRIEEQLKAGKTPISALLNEVQTVMLREPLP